MNEKQLKDLQAAGKIRGYEKSPLINKPAGNPHYSRARSEALGWLKWNLMYWSNAHALELVPEYRFDPSRKWRFDFCFPSIKCAVEYEGGIFMDKSGHNTARHYTKDSDKYNRAVVLGWRVIRVTALNYKTILEQLNELIK